MTAQHNRDLVDHATRRCHKVLDDIVTLVDTPDEAAMIIFTVGSRLLLASAKLMAAEKLAGFHKLTEVQRACVIAGVLATILAGPKENSPSMTDITPNVDAAVRRLQRMLVEQMV
ncbi:MAG: hypothetical protein ABWY63_14370 [Hyphomicrobiaceae bacterium]